MNNQWRFKGNEIKYVTEVLNSGEGSSTTGSFNSAFERLFAEKVGAKYAVTFNSGTSTLHAALDSLGIFISIIQHSGNIIGLKDKLKGHIGVITKPSKVLYKMGPPADIL